MSGSFCITSTGPSCGGVLSVAFTPMWGVLLPCLYRVFMFSLLLLGGGQYAPTGPSNVLLGGGQRALAGPPMFLWMEVSVPLLDHPIVLSVVC